MSSSQEEQHRRVGIFSRAFHYVRHTIQERTAPEVPREDIEFNEKFRQQIVKTPAYQKKLNSESKIRQKEQKDLKEIEKRAQALAIEKGKEAVEAIKEKGYKLGEEAAEKSKEALKVAQVKMGKEPSNSESLVQQAKETAQVAFEAAKDKAAPYVEEAMPAIKEATKDYIDPALVKVKEAAIQAYDVASSKVQLYGQEHPDSKIVQTVQEIKEKSSEIYEKAKETETGQKLMDLGTQAKDIGISAQQRALDVIEGRETLKDVAGDLKNKAKKTNESISGLASKGLDQVKEYSVNFFDKDGGAEQIQEQASHAAEVTKEKFIQLKDKSQELLEQAKQSDMGQEAIEYSEKIVEKSKELGEVIKEKAPQYAEQAKLKAKDIAVQVKEKAPEYYEQAKTKTEEFTQNVKEKASKLQEDAKEKAADAQQQAQDKAAQAADQIKEKGLEIKKALQSNEAINKAKEVAEKVKEKAEDISSKASDQIKESNIETQEKVREAGDKVKGQPREDIQKVKDNSKNKEQGGQGKKQKLQPKYPYPEESQTLKNQTTEDSKIPIISKRRYLDLEQYADQKLEETIDSFPNEIQDRYRRSLFISKLIHEYDSQNDPKFFGHQLSSSHSNDTHFHVSEQEAQRIERDLYGENVIQSQKENLKPI